MSEVSRDICIVDDGITELEHTRILELLTGSLWRYGWPYPYSPLERPCWHSFIAGIGRDALEDCEEELRARPDWGFLADIWVRFKRAHMPTAVLLGVYANGQTSSQDGPIHRDNTVGMPGKTLMLFCSEHWATCWGGELVFYDRDKESIALSVQPKPRRVVIFNGEVPHGASGQLQSSAHEYRLQNTDQGVIGHGENGRDNFGVRRETSGSRFSRDLIG